MCSSIVRPCRNNALILLRRFCRFRIVFHAPAHFHAWYNEYKVTVSIKDSVVKGEMPGRALKMILEWLELHREELMADWEKAQKGDPLDKFAPLK